MKEHYLDIHSDNCRSNPNYVKEHNEYDYLDNFCALNPERFLFFVGNDFYLITYHDCTARSNDYDFKIKLIERIIQKYEIFELYEINRGINIEDDLRNFRIRNQNLRKYIKQVNFIYSSFSTEYAITTTVDYLDRIFNQEMIKENYKKAKEFLIANEYTWLINQLDELMSANYLHEPNNMEYFKTIDHLIYTINNQIKQDGNCKES